nr:TRAP transporter small permease subunit [Desulfobacula sp.]
LASRKRVSIRITWSWDSCPDLTARVITFVSTVVTTVFMGYLWWYLFKMVQSAIRYESTSGTLTNTPLWIPQTVMLVGAGCFFIQLFATSLKTLAAINTKEEVV